MNQLFVPTRSAEDWRQFLAEPEKQWRDGYSAKNLAECWEAASSFPTACKAMFTRSSNPALRNLELLLAIPEHKVSLPGGGSPLQNDLFVLAKAADGALVSITIEGKAAEPFGDTLGAWLIGASTGKRRRLELL